MFFHSFRFRSEGKDFSNSLFSHHALLLPIFDENCLLLSFLIYRVEVLELLSFYRRRSRYRDTAVLDCPGMSRCPIKSFPSDSSCTVLPSHLSNSVLLGRYGQLRDWGPIPVAVARFTFFRC